LSDRQILITGPQQARTGTRRTRRVGNTQDNAFPAPC